MLKLKVIAVETNQGWQEKLEMEVNKWCEENKNCRPFSAQTETINRVIGPNVKQFAVTFIYYQLPL